MQSLSLCLKGTDAERFEKFRACSLKPDGVSKVGGVCKCV